MPQSLIRMPETAEFIICGWNITILNRKIEGSGGFPLRILCIIEDSFSDREILYQFEKHGINFEMMIEECAREFEHEVKVLAKIIDWQRDKMIAGGLHVKKRRNDVNRFSKSVEGRLIADQYIEKIRSCNNWGELYDELNMQSKFQKDMKKRVKKEFVQCRKV